MRSQDQSMEKQRNGMRFNGMKGIHTKVQNTDASKKFAQRNFNFNSGDEEGLDLDTPKKQAATDSKKTTSNNLLSGLGGSLNGGAKKPGLNLKGLGGGGIDLQKLIF